MTNITAEEVKQRLDAGEELNLVDVREPDERAAFNIGGLFIPLGKIQTMQTDEIDELKNEEVIFYCRSGNRSGQACLILETMGFTNVKNLVGGMNDWQAKNLS
ncbi:MAG: rhodanese-like domain-containing protein [Chitinophagaceae bacterium]|nr:MAG: rhodanese-like domain-containing protein [Chitinophagaceae bacterium]